MKTAQLAWGKEYLTFQFPEEVEIHTIEAAPTQAIANFAEEVQRALEHPINSLPLKEIVKPGEKVAIIVSDITRLSFRTDGYLPIVLNELNKAGVPDQDITVVMSTGTHRVQTPEEHRLIVGDEAFARVKIEDHDCLAKDLVYLGKSSRGTEITVNRTVYEADRVILTGGVSYHLLAGFGGGRKSIAPGVTGYLSIQQNHGLALKDVGPSGLHPYVLTGVTKGNPVAEDMVEIAEKVGADFLINVVVNEKKEYIAVVAGEMNAAFEQGCRVVERAFGIPTDRQSDLVIASCGGYPKDIQLYQAIKGLDNAAYAVRDQGVIILISACSDGTGSDEFMRWFKYPDVHTMREALHRDFTMPGFVALRTASIISQAKVILISTLPDEVVRGVNMVPAKNPEEAWSLAKQYLGEVKTITLMPHGALTFPIISAGS